MLSATVAQKPTMPVSDGMKKRTNSRVVWNLLGELRTGPKPPASDVIHHNISRPTESMNGAATPSRILIVSIPRQTTSMFSPQKKKKQVHMPAEDPLAAGQRICSMVKIACPPIQV